MKITDEMVMRGQLATNGLKYGLTDAEMRAALEAAVADVPEAEAVRVKPLEWVEHGDQDFVWYRAMTTVGLRYNVEDDGFSEKKFHLTVGQLVLGNFDVLDEAKAAAQADYERRILSALSAPAPAPTKDDESLWRDKAQEQAKTIDVLYNALRKILFARPLGPLPNTKLGKLVEEIEVIARDAVDRHEHRRAALNAETTHD